MAELNLITSGAYIAQELAAEFGQLPPSFLPMGVSRLYEAQATRLQDAPIYLSVPETFEPGPFDRNRLQELGVTLIPVPEGIQLGESIAYALNYIGGAFDAIRILHGDTLIGEMPRNMGDTIAVAQSKDNYSWAAVDLSDGFVVSLETISAGSEKITNRPVACGYFAIDDSRMLVRCITRARGNFINGLNIYAKERPVRAIFATDWLDFGHIQTYFQSRRSINTARSFNRLIIDDISVRKSSNDKEKIRAESDWYKKAPANVQPYCARIIESGEENGQQFYSTVYEYAPTLAELFVFSSIGQATWRRILRSCQSFLEACSINRGPGSGDAVLNTLAIRKTKSRLEKFSKDSGFDIHRNNKFNGKYFPSLWKISEELESFIDLTSGRGECLMHGDFCFSNILYNSRAARIIVIDPRGSTHGDSSTCFGDLRYDLAKFSHSIFGYYDLVLAGRYRMTGSRPHNFSIDYDTGSHGEWLKDALAEITIDGISANSTEIRALTVGLFLSMLPLHADRPDRQSAFVATALRLYAELEGRDT
ncbi:hypothetical protein [Methylobacterium radiotolerans]